MELALQHLPDFKGIETTTQGPLVAAKILQHLPDFKGIETTQEFGQMRVFDLQHLPDFKGIETTGMPTMSQSWATTPSLRR